MLRFKQFIQEDNAVPVNNAGGGQVAGIGVGPKGEPGVSPKNHTKGKKKKTPVMTPRPLSRLK